MLVTHVSHWDDAAAAYVTAEYVARPLGASPRVRRVGHTTRQAIRKGWTLTRSMTWRFLVHPKGLACPASGDHS